MRRLLCAGLAAGAALWGCAVAPPDSPSPPPVSAPSSPPLGGIAGVPRYRCDQGTEFTVRFAQDTALIVNPKRGSEVLLRDAGGLTPQQTVYSNARLRAEFGLGPAGREARLRYLPEPEVAHCVRD
jgi:hypothetical protein